MVCSSKPAIPLAHRLLRASREQWHRRLEAAREMSGLKESMKMARLNGVGVAAYGRGEI